jgi:hypothetical protein
MAVTPKLLIAGTLLTDAAVTLYTAGDNIVSRVNEIILCNTDTGARTVDIHMIDSGDTLDDKNKIVSALAIAAGETRFIGLDQIMGAGDFIQALADVTLKVSIRASGIEVS